MAHVSRLLAQGLAWVRAQTAPSPAVPTPTPPTLWAIGLLAGFLLVNLGFHMAIIGEKIVNFLFYDLREMFIGKFKLWFQIWQTTWPIISR